MQIEQFREKYSYVFDLLRETFSQDAVIVDRCYDYDHAYDVAVSVVAPNDEQWRAALHCQRERCTNILEGTLFVNEDGENDVLPPEGGWKYVTDEMTPELAKDRVASMYAAYSKYVEEQA